MNRFAAGYNSCYSSFRRETCQKWRSIVHGQRLQAECSIWCAFNRENPAGGGFGGNNCRRMFFSTVSSARHHHHWVRENYYSKTNFRGNRSVNGGTTRKTGLFGKPVFSTAEGFRIATKEALISARKLVEDIEAMSTKPPSAEIAEKMDELSDVLCRVADLSECIRFVHPDSDVRNAAQQASLDINAYVEELNTDASLHRSLQRFMASQKFESADEVTQRTAQLLVHDFEACGIHLEKEIREKIVQLNNKILELSHAFVSNVALPTLIPPRNCPPALLRHFPKTADGSYVAVDHVPLQNPDSNLRASSYAAYFAEIPRQAEILKELLKSRHEVSKLAGYTSYAHKTLTTCMARNPETVLEFLEKLSARNLPLAQEEVEEMKKYIYKLSTDDNSIQLYDAQYCSAQAKTTLFSTKPSQLCDYFSLHSTLDGLRNLSKALFGVTMETVSTHPGEVWSDDIIKLAFVDEENDGLLLGYTYLDLFERKGKSITDCHFTIQGGRELNDGSYQLPIITLCCNFTRCGGSHGNPLLSLSSVENLFHEMGHAFHSVLGRSRYQNVTGTRCSTDFAEVPSTLMEWFLSDSRVIQNFARHHETGRPIPRSHTSYIELSGKPFPAYDLQIQIVQSMTDVLLHSNAPSDPVRVANDVFSQYSPMPPLPGATWLLRFNHLYGYGARYYSYLWAHAMSSLIWNRCFSSDPFSRVSGTRLRKMLAVGGGVAPDKLVSDLLNFDPCVDDLVVSLHSSIMEHRLNLSLLSKS